MQQVIDRGKNQACVFQGLSPGPCEWLKPILPLCQKSKLGCLLLTMVVVRDCDIPLGKGVPPVWLLGARSGGSQQEFFNCCSFKLTFISAHNTSGSVINV